MQTPETTAQTSTRRVWTAPTLQVSNIRNAQNASNPGLLDLGVGGGGIGVGIFTS